MAESAKLNILKRHRTAGLVTQGRRGPPRGRGAALIDLRGSAGQMARMVRLDEGPHGHQGHDDELKEDQPRSEIFRQCRQEHHRFEGGSAVTAASRKEEALAGNETSGMATL